MDIWEWTYETRRQLQQDGEARLAHLMRRIPSLACQDDHAELDAAYPEALAHARRLGLPWVELFVRHWHLQSRILHRMETGQYLSEAVDLLEFAHREEHIECPQSVCTTQDLAVAYGQRDGKGFVPERLEAAGETLARIDPSWQCFECIVNEYVSALIDGDRADEALAFLEARTDELERTCSAEVARRRATRFRGARVSALRALDRLEEACELAQSEVERLRTEGHDSHQLHHRQLDCARLLARLDRPEEGLEYVPDWSTIWNTPKFYHGAARAYAHLVAAGAMPNTWELGHRLLRMARRLEGNGVLRQAITVGRIHAELALDRDSPEVAALSLDLIERLLPDLRAPHEDAEHFATLRQRAQARIDQREPADLSAQLERDERVEMSGDPEQDLPRIEALLSIAPDSDGPLILLADAWEAVGAPEAALEALRQGLRDHPSAERLVKLGDLLVEGDQREQALTLAEDHLEDELLEAPARWLRARLRLQSQDRDGALDDLERVRQLHPDHPTVRTLEAQVRRAQGQLELALKLYDAQLERFPSEDGSATSVDWDRMVVATQLGRWDRVHESARRVGFDFDVDEGPIDEPFQLCRICFEGELERPSYWAVRTGPVTARVVQLAMLDRPQHSGDVVAFDAAPLNPRPEDWPEDQDYHFEYPAVAVLEPGGLRDSYSLNGARPPEPQAEALGQKLSEQGLTYEPISASGYTVTDPETDEDLPGLYALVGVPEQMPLDRAHALLTEACQDLEHPLQWVRLARDIGEAELAERHEELRQRYQMTQD